MTLFTQITLAANHVVFITTAFLKMFPLLNEEITLSGNRSSLQIDLITEDPKIRKRYCIEKSITNNRNTGNKSLYNFTKKRKILFNSSKHENILSLGMQTLGTKIR